MVIALPSSGHACIRNATVAHEPEALIRRLIPSDGNWPYVFLRKRLREVHSISPCFSTI